MRWEGKGFSHAHVWYMCMTKSHPNALPTRNLPSLIRVTLRERDCISSEGVDSGKRERGGLVIRMPYTYI